MEKEGVAVTMIQSRLKIMKVECGQRRTEIVTIIEKRKIVIASK